MINDRREWELARLGYMALVSLKNTNSAVFFSVPSCYRPKSYSDEQVSPADAVLVRLDNTLAANRFAHYLRCLLRDQCVSYMSKEHCERDLNFWISQYVLSDDEAGPEMRARFPLKFASVELTEVPGIPGRYRAILWIQPSYQFVIDEGVGGCRLRIVVNFPRRGR